MVSAWPNIARHAWPTTPTQRWLYSPDAGDFGTELSSLLVDSGITELTFIGQKQEEVNPYLDHFSIDEQGSYDVGRWEISVLVAVRDRSVASEY